MDDSPSDDPLDFTPVPDAGRHDGWTAARQRGFILALAEHGGVAAAARGVGMTPQTANRLRRRPGAEDFARAWAAALEEGRARSVDEAMRRGIEGYVVPVMRGGRIVGHRHRLDNRLLYAACYAQPIPRNGM